MQALNKWLSRPEMSLPYLTKLAADIISSGAGRTL